MKTLFFSFLCVSTAFSYNVVLKKSSSLPITVFNLTFNVGSANDPEKLKGIANLTGHLIREGGVKKMGEKPARSREEIEEFLFPMAADIGVDTNKEQTSFTVTTTSETAEAVFDLLSQMVLAPAFPSSELERLKGEVKDLLEKKLPLEDQEELGKAALDWALYGNGHPYASVEEGSLKSLPEIDADKISEFYQSHYTQENLTLAVGGVISENLEKKLKSAFSTLPKGGSDKLSIVKPKKQNNLHLTIVTGPFESTGVHIGFVEDFNRNSSEYAAMYLGATGFGKHRSFVGRLMKVVREARGLNYGTYAYIEDFPNGGRTMIAPTQAARQVQAFTMWGRPTPANNGCFLLKQMLREYDLLTQNGLSAEEFNLTKSHLNGYIPLLATEMSRQLGYAIDSHFYGIENDFLAVLQKSNEKLDRKTVNATIQKHLSAQKPTLVVVTKDAEGFLKALRSDACLIHYPEGVTKDKKILKEDEVIAKYPVKVNEEDIKVISSKELFN